MVFSTVSGWFSVWQFILKIIAFLHAVTLQLITSVPNYNATWCVKSRLISLPGSFELPIIEINHINLIRLLVLKYQWERNASVSFFAMIFILFKKYEQLKLEAQFRIFENNTRMKLKSTAEGLVRTMGHILNKNE